MDEDVGPTGGGSDGGPGFEDEDGEDEDDDPLERDYGAASTNAQSHSGMSSFGSIPDVLFKKALSFLALTETIVSSASCRRFLTRARKILAELEEINGNKSWYMLTLADPTKQPLLIMKSSGSAPACHPHFPGENPSSKFKWHAHATDGALAFFGKHARSTRRVGADCGFASLP